MEDEKDGNTIIYLIQYFIAKLSHFLKDAFSLSTVGFIVCLETLSKEAVMAAPEIKTLDT